ncbi:hypothetical protein NE237_016144 [Protea cynaroides]|uniref:Uncharacterized protein n=1 Tax=Protea cynaroides TaxID=273540 RepID=A0A9Q0KF55_9MAGN|nr:hypothetical protein NE237_016144 [Protea cynaroides]
MSVRAQVDGKENASGSKTEEGLGVTTSRANTTPTGLGMGRDRPGRRGEEGWKGEDGGRLSDFTANMARFSLLSSALLLIIVMSFLMTVANIARKHARIDAQRPVTRSLACSTATSAVRHACASLQAHMGTRKNVHAITTGKQTMANPSALEALEMRRPI